MSLNRTAQCPVAPQHYSARFPSEVVVLPVQALPGQSRGPLPTTGSAATGSLTTRQQRRAQFRLHLVGHTWGGFCAGYLRAVDTHWKGERERSLYGAQGVLPYAGCALHADGTPGVSVAAQQEGLERLSGAAPLRGGCR